MKTMEELINTIERQAEEILRLKARRIVAGAVLICKYIHKNKVASLEAQLEALGKPSLRLQPKGLETSLSHLQPKPKSGTPKPKSKARTSLKAKS